MLINLTCWLVHIAESDSVLSPKTTLFELARMCHKLLTLSGAYIRAAKKTLGKMRCNFIKTMGSSVFIVKACLMDREFAQDSNRTLEE